MHLEPGATDENVLRELGRRLARTRLERNLSQAELAAAAGVGLRTLQRLEAGRDVQSSSLIRVLRELGLLEGLNRLVPEPPPSPIERLRLAGKAPKRAGRKRGGAREAARRSREPWRWGDEEEPGR